MNLLADENVHSAIVSWLRTSGHDVVYAAESLSSRADSDLLRLARDQGRILVTSDRDFGELVFRRRLVTAGVLLLRLEDRSIESRLAHLEACWSRIEPRLPDHFVVVTSGRIRVRRPP